MTSLQFRTELIIERMKVPDDPGLFVLGCLERPATVYMQQVRALNLIYALGRKEDRHARKMLVIGAGAGGITSAAAAAAMGWDVTIVEKMQDVLSLADGGSSHRWLHPHIYDWPADGAEERKTRLGILDWTAESSRVVADELRGKWRRLEDAYKIKTHVGIADLTLGKMANGQWLVRWNGAGARPTGNGRMPTGYRPISRMQQATADVVVLAVGFGKEVPTPDFPGIESYWENDKIDAPKEKDPHQPIVLVSGTGDGALIDALRYSYRNFRHERVIKNLRDGWLGPSVYQRVKDELHAIEEAVMALAAAGQAHDVELNCRYHELVQTLSEQRERIEFRDDAVLFVTGRDKYPLSLRAAPINRFLFTLTNAQYRQGDIVKAVKGTEGKWKVVFQDGESEQFSDVVIRHGPRPELSKQFPDIYNKLALYRDSWDKAVQTGRDPTRDPLYDDTFVASLEAATKAADTSTVNFATLGDMSVDAPGEDSLQTYRGFLEATLGSPLEHHNRDLVGTLLSFALHQGSNGGLAEQTRLLSMPAGTGKTALLREIARRLLVDQVKLPLLLPLRLFDASLHRSLFAHAIDTVLNALVEDEAVRNRLRAALLVAVMQGKLVLLLDGFDEMPPPRRVDLLNALYAGDDDLRRGNAVLLVSRPLAAQVEGLPVIPVRIRIAKNTLLNVTLDRVHAIVVGSGVPARLVEGLERAALKSLLGNDVGPELAKTLAEPGLAEAHEATLQRWLTWEDGEAPSWKFDNPVLRDVLATKALERAGDIRKIVGLAFEERWSRCIALPLALAAVSEPDRTHVLLEGLPDTLDWQILILRLQAAQFSPPRTNDIGQRLVRDTARVVASPRLATLQGVMSLAQACRGLPPVLSALLSAEVLRAFQRQDQPEWYRAIRFLAHAEVPDAVGILQSWLLDESDVVADAAAVALGELGREAAIPGLRSAYLSSPKSFVFRAAVEAIAAIGGDAATEALLDILSNRQLYRNFRWPAAAALAKLNSQRAREVLLEESAAPNPILRANIATALGSYPGRKTVERLARMARDQDDDVRINAFESLARVAEAGDIATLERGLDDAVDGVRMAAAEGLLRLDPERLLTLLEKGLTLAGSPWREQAAVLLARMLGPAAGPALVRLSREADRYARLGAARGLARFTDDVALAVLIGLAGDDDDEVRAAAIQALPQLDRTDVVDAIVRNLEEETPSLAASAAVDQLRGFRGARPAEALRRAALRPDYIGAKAAAALGTIGEASDIDLIVTGWHGVAAAFPISDDTYAMAIARIGGDQACRALRLFLDHPQVARRLSALEALAQVQEAAVVPGILHALGDGDPLVQRRASNALQHIDRVRLVAGLKLGLRSESVPLQRNAARLAVPYADREMLDALQAIDSAGWGEGGAASYESLLRGMREVDGMRRAASEFLRDVQMDVALA